MIIGIILLCICFIIIQCYPYLDVYTDSDNVKHIILWYSDFNGNRKFIKIL